MSYCKQTDGNLAALDAWQKKQAMLDLSAQEFERAKMKVILHILGTDWSPANDYTGLELVQESLSERNSRVFGSIVELLHDAAAEAETFEDFRDAIDAHELGMKLRDIMLPYFEEVAHGRAEEYNSEGSA